MKPALSLAALLMSGAFSASQGCTERLEILLERKDLASEREAPADASVPDHPIVPRGYAIAVGHRHSCTIQNGPLLCWGSNEFGQLGRDRDSAIAQGQPVPLPGDRRWKGIALGAVHSCGLVEDGEMRCWGRNNQGQLGRSGQQETHRPLPVRFDAEAVDDPDAAVADIAAGANHTCARFSNGKVFCWGDNRSGQLGVDPAELAYTEEPRRFGDRDLRFSQVFTGTETTCALRASDPDDTGPSPLFCAGRNAEAQLGRLEEDRPPDFEPAPANALSDAIFAGGAGSTHACILTDRDVVSCWGSPQEGRLGLKNPLDGAPRPIADDVSIPGLVTALSVGIAGTCAITNLGTTHCWGNNRDGQLGLRELEVAVRPTRLEASYPVAAIAIGPTHSCALSESGKVYCTGSNDVGQLGDLAQRSELEFVRVQFQPL